MVIAITTTDLLKALPQNYWKPENIEKMDVETYVWTEPIIGALPDVGQPIALWEWTGKPSKVRAENNRNWVEIRPGDILVLQQGDDDELSVGIFNNED